MVRGAWVLWGGDDRQDVSVGMLEQVFDAVVGLNAWEILVGDIQAFGVQFADSDRGHARQLHFIEMVLAHVERPAVADDADFDVLGFFEAFHEKG